MTPVNRGNMQCPPYQVMLNTVINLVLQEYLDDYSGANDSLCISLLFKWVGVDGQWTIFFHQIGEEGRKQKQEEKFTHNLRHEL